MKTSSAKTHAPPAHDERQLIRETTHRTDGSRAPTMPVEHSNQPRKHDRHRGPRASKTQAQTEASP
jgi:hypothetical protein